MADFMSASNRRKYSLLIVVVLCPLVSAKNAGDVFIEGTGPLCNSQPDTPPTTFETITKTVSASPPAQFDPPDIKGFSKAGRFPADIRLTYKMPPKSMKISSDGQIIVLSFVLQKVDYQDTSKKQINEGLHAFVYLKCDSEGLGVCEQIKMEQFRSEYALITFIDDVMYVPDLCKSYTRRVRISGGKVETLQPIQLNMSCPWNGAHSAQVVSEFHRGEFFAIYSCHDFPLGVPPCNKLSKWIYIMNATTGQCKELRYSYDRNGPDTRASLDRKDYQSFVITDVLTNVYGCDLLMFTSHGIQLLDLVSLRLSANFLKGTIMDGDVDKGGNIYVSTCNRDNLADRTDTKPMIMRLSKTDVVRNVEHERLNVLQKSQGPGKIWLPQKIMVTKAGLAVWWADYPYARANNYRVLQFYSKNGMTFPGMRDRQQFLQNKIQCTNVKTVEGGWSKWSQWSPCSVTCGQGVSTKKRTCDNPTPTGHHSYCNSDPVISTKCNNPQCEVISIYSHWDQWRPCSVTCGTGYRQRARVCNLNSADGQDCDGEGIMTEQCTVGSSCCCMERALGSHKPSRINTLTYLELPLFVVLELSILSVILYTWIAVTSSCDGFVVPMLQAIFGYTLVVGSGGLVLSFFFTGLDAACKLGLVLYHWGTLLAISAVFVTSCQLFMQFKDGVVLNIACCSLVIMCSSALMMTCLELVPIFRYYVDERDDRCWFSPSGTMQHLLPHAFFTAAIACTFVVARCRDRRRPPNPTDDLDRIARKHGIRRCLSTSVSLSLSWTTLSAYNTTQLFAILFCAVLFILIHTVIANFGFLNSPVKDIHNDDQSPTLYILPDTGSSIDEDKQETSETLTK